MTQPRITPEGRLYKLLAEASDSFEDVSLALMEAASFPSDRMRHLFVASMDLRKAKRDLRKALEAVEDSMLANADEGGQP